MEGIQHIEKGGVFMPNDIFQQYTKFVAETATKATYNLIREEEKRAKLNEKISTRQAAKEENVSVTTVLSWINDGLKDGKIKLKATKKGKRDLQILRSDLEKFKEARDNHNKYL